MMTQTVSPSPETIARTFVSRTKSISPTVLRLGGGDGALLTIRELEAAIVVDPEFSLRTLALANSAFYSQQHEISSLRSALVVLGSETVHNLAASLLAQALVTSSPTPDESLWRHCLAVGALAQMLAELHRKVDSRSAFAAGLLHDIGILALQVLGEEDQAQFACHEDIGGRIARTLGLSTTLSHAIVCHGRYASGSHDSAALEATIYVANNVAIRFGYSHESESPDQESLLMDALAFLELEESDIDALVGALPTRLQAMEACSP